MMITIDMGSSFLGNFERVDKQPTIQAVDIEDPSLAQHLPDLGFEDLWQLKQAVNSVQALTPRHSACVNHLEYEK